MKDMHGAEPGGTPSEGPLEDAVNVALDLEAAGELANARRVLAEASRRYPEALARVAALRGAEREMRRPVAHGDLTSRVMDQWEREELLEVSDVSVHAPAATGRVTPAAVGAGSSQTRHRRPRGAGRVQGWTAVVAGVLGLAVAGGLYFSNRGSSSGTVPVAPERASPHLLHGAPAVAFDQPSPGGALRLGNAGAYDHAADQGGPLIASRAARLRYDASPTDAWVFGSLGRGRAHPVTDETAAVLLTPSLGVARLRFATPAGGAKGLEHGLFAPAASEDDGPVVGED
ncbi:MAG: hypothetical protein U0637_01810 [Phycisphaerales bacterium]